MENNNDWLEKTTKEIVGQQERLSDSDNKKYKLDVLLCVAKRVNGFSDDCEKCKNSKEEIEKLVDKLNQVEQQSTEERNNYFYIINLTIRHLQKSHKLIPRGYYTGIGIPVGVIIGAGIGFALSKIWISVGIGLCLFLFFGGSLDAKAKREGRVL